MTTALAPHHNLPFILRAHGADHLKQMILSKIRGWDFYNHLTPQTMPFLWWNMGLAPLQAGCNGGTFVQGSTSGLTKDFIFHKPFLSNSFVLEKKTSHTCKE
jgi:hypothetical protein